MISIRGLSKASVLAALYNNSRAQGMSFLYASPGDMSAADAEAFTADDGRGLYFDYLRGRVMKVDLSGDEFDPRLYDRDNGHGAAERAIAGLRWKSANTAEA